MRAKTGEVENADGEEGGAVLRSLRVGQAVAGLLDQLFGGIENCGEAVACFGAPLEVEELLFLG